MAYGLVQSLLPGQSGHRGQHATSLVVGEPGLVIDHAFPPHSSTVAIRVLGQLLYQSNVTLVHAQ